VSSIPVRVTPASTQVTWQSSWYTRLVLLAPVVSLRRTHPPAVAVVVVQPEEITMNAPMIRKIAPTTVMKMPAIRVRSLNTEAM
jgi:hypothetical protein